MQLVPEVTLDLLHVGPSVHAVRLNISDLGLILFLNFFVAFDVAHKICFFGSLNDYLSDFLRRLDLLNLGLLLEPLLDDLAD